MDAPSLLVQSVALISIWQMTNARTEELDLLFSEARTHNVWQDRPVDDELLKRAYELARMGPTGGNSQPLRIVFVKSAEAKKRLEPALMPQNVEKTITAPVTAIIAWDSEYWEQMPKLFPDRPQMKDTIAGLPPPVREGMGTQSADLQAGYFILAARALGLDCGPMGGFDRAKVDAAFLGGTTWRSLLLVNVGYGVQEKLYPRNPRLSFEEAARVE